ncbi:MAG TPA: hypothetical protein VGU25_17450 [Acidobacteriaceae bacterium]|nr:hypothetical protein [Acidobacteriaceae bacterium]
MASQTFIFVALPNGQAKNGNLKLSVYLTPRLDDGATLAAFPDMLTWPQSIKSHGLKFQISCGANKATVSADKAVLRPDIWQTIFTPDTFVEPYQFPTYSDGVFVSYPTRQALGYLKYAYQSFSLQSSRQDGREGPFRVFNPLAFRNGAKSTLGTNMAEQRKTMWQLQQALVETGTVPAVDTTFSGPTSNPDGVATTLVTPNEASTQDMITRFALFHSIPKAHHRPPLPSPPNGFNKTLDFHSALTAVSSYPSILRALGLVFDLEIPSSLCPPSPSGGAYASVAVSKVVPGFNWQITPSFSLTPTSYWRDSSSFCAAPAAVPAAQTAGNYPAGDVFKGFLAMSAQNFFLSQVDLDGALMKAMGLADNVANLLVNDNLQAMDETLPSLRSAGISLMADGNGLRLLQSILNNQSFNDSLSSNNPTPYNAQDLVRGYRIDIWSSRTKRWHSLHSRTATYKFGSQSQIVLNVDEEGFTQLSAAQAADDPTRKPDQYSIKNDLPQPAQNVYIHERVARWNGWSLSVSRPVKPLNRSADPAKALDSDPTLDAPVTPFKMVSTFAVSPGSLPELRFGAQYRLRARSVDLAGNSVPVTTSASNLFAAPANGVQMKYMRFEPVVSPLLALRQPTSAGSSLARLVIRSYNSSLALDTQITSETDERHVAPPRVAERMVEEHGLLDSQGKPVGNAAMYQFITQRDAFELPTKNKIPLVPGDTLTVGYFPDPFASGAAFRNLPNTPSDTSGHTGKSGLKYATLPDVDVRPGSVTYVDFGTKPWPNASSFRIVLAEGNGQPAWDFGSRVLTVYLQKAGLISVPLSCYLTPDDLELMGVWGWLREFFEAIELNALTTGADDSFSTASDDIAELTRLVLEGGYPMITPSLSLTLVHAVQQPLGEPTFIQLPVVHDEASPILASALRNAFTPITAWRSVGLHEAVLLGGMQINGASTSKIDIHGRWLEVTDNPALPAPTQAVASQLVETIDLSNLTAGAVYSESATQPAPPQFIPRMVGVYIPQVDVLWFSGPQDTLGGVDNPSTTDPAAPIHRFDDTRHRWIEYTPIGTSRFEEYFPAGLDFTRTGPTLIVDVPSSARPTIPDIAYVVPTFGWELQETTNVKSAIRHSNGLRVYLNRGWYSSGQDELLGVMLWSSQSPAPDYLTRETNKSLFTQWGADPIWDNGELTIQPVPAIGNFPNAVATAIGLTIPESSLVFDVAGHEVAYDSTRSLWYCDIEISGLFNYGPFVRLAVARYQTHSIAGVELSPVALADFAQIAPDRSAVLSINPANPKTARLFVGGLAPNGPVDTSLQISVETRALNIASDLDWIPAPTTDVTVTEDTGLPSEANAVLWSGSIVFAKNPAPNQYRIVIREYETLPADAASGKITDPPALAQRLIYAAILGYD